MTSEVSLSESVERALAGETAKEAADILTGADLSQIDQASLDKLVCHVIGSWPTYPYYLRVVSLVTDKVRNKIHKDFPVNGYPDELKDVLADERSLPYRDAIMLELIKYDFEGLEKLYSTCIGRVSQETRTKLCKAIGKSGEIGIDDLAHFLNTEVADEDFDTVLDGLIEENDEDNMLEIMKSSSARLSDAQTLRLARAIQRKK